MSLDVDAERPWAIKDRAAPEPAIKRFARSSRSSPTDAERKLWSHLKRLDIDGTHFRRQVVIGRYIADFACARLRLIVEADGGQHAESEKDAARTAALEGQGWRVLRFWNNDVLSNIEGVISVIRSEVERASAAISSGSPTLGSPDVEEKARP